MPDTPELIAYVRRTVTGGLSANQGLRDFIAAGGAIRRATWLGAVAEYRANLSIATIESANILTGRPLPQHIQTINTKTKSGYIQQVDVYVVDRETGEVTTKPFSWRTRVLITRRQAISEAKAAFQLGIIGSPDRFNERVLGATYSGTLQLVPRGSV